MTNPYASPPVDGRPVSSFSSQLVAPAATALLARVQLAQNETLRLTGLGQEITDDPAGTALTGFANTVWRLLVDGIPHEHFGLIVDQLGRGYQDSGSVNIEVRTPGSLVELVVTNNHGADSFLCFGRISGWTVPGTPQNEIAAAAGIE